MTYYGLSRNYTARILHDVISHATTQTHSFRPALHVSRTTSDKEHRSNGPAIAAEVLRKIFCPPALISNTGKQGEKSGAAPSLYCALCEQKEHLATPSSSLSLAGASQMIHAEVFCRTTGSVS